MNVDFLHFLCLKCSYFNSNQMTEKGEDKIDSLVTIWSCVAMHVLVIISHSYILFILRLQRDFYFFDVYFFFPWYESIIFHGCTKCEGDFFSTSSMVNSTLLHSNQAYLFRCSCSSYQCNLDFVKIKIFPLCSLFFMCSSKQEINKWRFHF